MSELKKRLATVFNEEVIFSSGAGAFVAWELAIIFGAVATPVVLGVAGVGAAVAGLMAYCQQPD